MGKYHVFLSCKEDITIGDECIGDFLSKQIRDGRVIAIECIKKHADLKLAKEDLDDFKESCIYVVNTHADFDYMTYWELGYVMGKGIKIIGYYDGNTRKKIPPDVEGLINVPDDVARFLDKLNRIFSELKPLELPLIEDWDKLRNFSMKEPEAL